MILGKSPTFLRNVTFMPENVESDSNVTSTSPVENEKKNCDNNEHFVFTTMFEEAEINSLLPDVNEMLQSNQFQTAESNAIPSLSEQEQDGLEYILGYIARKFKDKHSNLNLGTYTCNSTDDHTCSQPPSFVYHLLVDGLYKPSETFFNQGMSLTTI